MENWISFPQYMIVIVLFFLSPWRKENWFQFRLRSVESRVKDKLAWQVLGWGLWFAWTAAALCFAYAFFLGIVTPLVTQKHIAPDIQCARVDYSSPPRIRAVDQQSLRIKVRPSNFAKSLLSYIFMFVGENWRISFSWKSTRNSTSFLNLHSAGILILIFYFYTYQHLILHYFLFLFCLFVNFILLIVEISFKFLL